MTYRTVHLDELEAIPGPASLIWRPVRSHLGIRAFGTNAYTAEEAGADVVEPHDENDSDSHEELYFVARGRATFRLDDDEVNAPAGTYVFIPDPATRRHAVAEEPGTTVLSFGGPPTFEPSAWEWSMRAAGLRAAGDRDRARTTLEEGFAERPDSPNLHYELACWEATGGDPDAALAALRRAIEAEAELREHAQTDEDLASLRDAPDFPA
jgi:quercetin dioxygenase-like cupin family protein